MYSLIKNKNEVYDIFLADVKVGTVSFTKDKNWKAIIGKNENTSSKRKKAVEGLIKKIVMDVKENG